MSLFVPKEWKDRLAEFAGRRKLTNVSTGEETTVDVSRAEGEVSQAGDAFSAANMNDLEQRIKDGFDKVDTNLGNGEISFSVVDGEPYVKVGADPARPFKYKTKKYSCDYVAAYGKASITFDLKQDYPTTYDKLTIDNIIYGFEKLTYFQVNNFDLIISPSYDHTTGIVTLNISGSTSSGGYNSNGTVFIVVII